MHPNGQSLISLPDAEAGSYLQRVMQHGFGSAEITEHDIGRWERQLLSLADRLALKESRYTSPSNKEIRGARLLTAAWIANALEQKHGPDLSGAVRALQSSSLHELYRQGARLRGDLIRSLAEQLDELELRRQRFTLDQATFLESAGLLFHVHLEKVAEMADHSSSTARTYQQMMRELFNLATLMRIGLLLEQEFRPFFQQHRYCRYAEAVGNIVVHLAADRLPTPIVSLAEIQAFLKPSRSASEWSELGQRTTALWVHYGLRASASDWFVRVGWPQLTETYQLLSGKQISVERCRFNHAFYPKEQAGKKSYVTRGSIGSTEWSLLVKKFLTGNVSEQLALVQEFDSDIGNALLEELQQATSPDHVAALGQQLPEPVLLGLLFFQGLTSDDINANPPGFAAHWARHLIVQAIDTRAGERLTYGLAQKEKIIDAPGS